MNVEQVDDWERRAAVHAALADVTRLQIVDLLTVSDASSSEISRTLAVPGNLLAHHLKTLERVGLVERRRSEGDGRRTYLRLGATAEEVSAGLGVPGRGHLPGVRRMVFVCTANSARSHLAAALWARASDIPVASAGTHPADRVDPRAVEAARRHDVALLPGARPRTLAEVAADGDLLVTVCDRAHEELDRSPRDRTVHWSVPDPVRTGTPQAFDAAVELLTDRVGTLATRLGAAAS